MFMLKKIISIIVSTIISCPLFSMEMQIKIRNTPIGLNTNFSNYCYMSTIFQLLFNNTHYMNLLESLPKNNFNNLIQDFSSAYHNEKSVNHLNDADGFKNYYFDYTSPFAQTISKKLNYFDEQQDPIEFRFALFNNFGISEKDYESRKYNDFVANKKILRICSQENWLTPNPEYTHSSELTFPENLEFSYSSKTSVKNQEDMKRTSVCLQQLIDAYFSDDDKGVVCSNQCCKEIKVPLKNKICWTTAPVIHMFTINRNYYDENGTNKKIVNPIIMPNIIKIPIYDEKTRTSTPAIYKITSVVIHTGNSATSGHYYNFTLANDNQWNLINTKYVEDGKEGITLLKSQGYILHQQGHGGVGLRNSDGDIVIVVVEKIDNNKLIAVEKNLNIKRRLNDLYVDKDKPQSPCINIKRPKYSDNSDIDEKTISKNIPIDADTHPILKQLTPNIQKIIIFGFEKSEKTNDIRTIDDYISAIENIEKDLIEFAYQGLGFRLAKELSETQTALFELKKPKKETTNSKSNCNIF